MDDERQSKNTNKEDALRAPIDNQNPTIYASFRPSDTGGLRLPLVAADGRTADDTKTPDGSGERKADTTRQLGPVEDWPVDARYAWLPPRGFGGWQLRGLEALRRILAEAKRKAGAK